MAKDKRSGSGRRKTSGSTRQEMTTEVRGGRWSCYPVFVANEMEGGRRSGLVANEMECGRRSGRKLFLLSCVAAGLEGARHGFGQLFVEAGMDGSQGHGVQVIVLVAGGNEVGRLRGAKLLLLVATGTKNTAVTTNR